MTEKHLERARARMFGLAQAISPGDASPIPDLVIAEFDSLLVQFEQAGVDVAEWRIPSPRTERPSGRRRKGRAALGPPMLLLKARAQGLLAFTEPLLKSSRTTKPSLGFLSDSAVTAKLPPSVASAELVGSDARGVRDSEPVRTEAPSPVVSDSSVVVVDPAPDALIQEPGGVSVSIRPIADQSDLDAILGRGLGWVYNSFYRKLHHASCHRLRTRGSEAGRANFKTFYPTWAGSDVMPTRDSCSFCRPRRGQPAE